MAGSFQVDGIEEIQRALRELDRRVARKVVSRGLREGAKVVRKETVASAPVGETGAIKKSLKVRSAPRSRRTVGVRVQSAEGDFRGDTYYAAMTEFGTQFQPAQEWMQQSFDAKADEARQRAEDVMSKGIFDVVREVAWKR